MDSAAAPVDDTPKDAHEAGPRPLNSKRRVEPLHTPVTDAAVAPCFNSSPPPVPSRPVSSEPVPLSASRERACETMPAEGHARTWRARPLADAALAGAAKASASRKRERERALAVECDESPPWAPLPLPPEMMAVLDMPSPPPAPNQFDSVVTDGLEDGEGPAEKRLRGAGERRKPKSG